MNLSRTFTKGFSSSSSSFSSRNISCSQSIQNLLKSGSTPTLKTLNKFLILLYKAHRFELILQFFSQMNSKNINGNSQTHSIISNSLLKANKFEDAVSYITRLDKDQFFPNRRSFWDSLIQGLSNAGENPEKALSVLQDCLSSHGILPSPFTFYSLIHRFSSQGNMGRAIEALEVMISENVKYPINNFVFSSVISGFCKIGKPELALEFIKNARKIGALHGPNIVTYTALVSALCKEGRIKEVCELVCRMEKEGVVLDAVFYSSWICGYFQEGILEEAFRKHVSMVKIGIHPDTVSYTILIDGFSKEGNVEKAVGFLNEMKKDGLEPNLVTYTAIMRGFCKKGKLMEAFKLFRRVEELGIKMDEITYSTLIDGFCRARDFDRVFCLLEEMEQNKIKAGVITYNTVINGLCKVGRTLEGDKMSNNIVGDNFTYSTLLHGYIQENNVVGILETKKRLEEAGINMDVVMCNVLIKALFMVGSFENAYIIYKGMNEMGLVANSITYCTIIDGYCEAGRIDEALRIFDAYRSSSLVYSVATYDCIIFGLCQNNMVDMAIEVFIELIEKALVPSKVTYMRLINKISEERNGDGVLEFLERSDKMEPEIYSVMCNDATYYLCRQDCPEPAFGVYLLMRKKGSSLTSKGYYLILKGLIAGQNRLLVPVMLNAYLKDYGVSESRIIRILIQYLSKNDMKRAHRFLDKMKENHICVKIPVAIFEELKEQGRFLDAHKLITETKYDLTVFDVVSCSIVIDGLCKEGHLNKALDLCATMRKNGLSPNIVTYNSVINGLCKQGCIVQALRIFDSLEEINLVPTDRTYGSLISALSNEGCLQNAKQLFEKMGLKGCTPNNHVYNSLIDGYCKFGLLDEAFNLLLDLEKNNSKPDEFTVSAIIDGYCRKGDVEGALAFYFEYQKKGILPDFLGFLYLIKGLCVKGRMEEARSVLMEMLQIQSIVELIDRNSSGGIKSESLAHILVLLCEQGNIEEARDVLNEVGFIAFPSKRFSRSRELKAVYERKPVEIDKLDSSTKQNFQFDFEAFYSILGSLCSQGEIEKANIVAKELLLRA